MNTLKLALSSSLLIPALVMSLTLPAAAVDATPTPSPVPVLPNLGTCSASSATSSSSLGKFYAYVQDVTTGKVLLDINGSEATPSASVLKVLSVAAALTHLPPTYFATTRVLTVPSEPGTIVLQGGGDHTLSNMTKGSYTTYAKPARLETLANKVLTSWTSDQPVKKIILDSSFFSGPSYSPFWLASDRTNGYISHITALQVCTKGFGARCKVS